MWLNAQCCAKVLIYSPAFPVGHFMTSRLERRNILFLAQSFYLHQTIVSVASEGAGMNERMNQNDREKENFINRNKIVSEFVQKEGKDYIYKKSVCYEYEYAGFWMRMYSNHFRPCQKCQLEILKLLKTSQIDFTSQTMNITFHQRFKDEKKTQIYYEFGFPFIIEHFNHWKPCVDCQKEVLKIVQKAKNIHIGNKDYAYPIELYKEYDVDDTSWVEVEKRLATKEEIQDSNLRID